MTGPAATQARGAAAATRRRALLAAPALIAAPARGQARPFRILMALFRGWEEACDGFRDHFAARRIPVEFIIRNVEQDLARVPALIAEARVLAPDLVHVWGTSLALALLGPWDAPAGRFLTEFPAVFSIVTDPVGNRLIRTRAAPGRAVTGTEYIAPVPVQLRAMARYRGFRKLAAIHNPQERNSLSVMAEMQDLLGDAFTALPVPLNASGRPDPGALPACIEQARGADWLYIPPDTFLNEHRHLLTRTALAAGLPCFSATERFVLFSDGLAGLVSRYYSVGAFTAFKAEQILRGQAPERIPVESLTRLSFLIRMGTAQALGLYPPVSLLRVAETL